MASSRRRIQVSIFVVSRAMISSAETPVGEEVLSGMGGAVGDSTGGMGETGVESGDAGEALLDTDGDKDRSEGVEGAGESKGVQVATVISEGVGDDWLDSLEGGVWMRILPQLCLLLILFEDLLGVSEFALMDPGIF